jgi:selenocysteine lyase/cysteine desulfurase
MIDLDDLNKKINPLSEFYSKFRVNERILLTGHSHQAWPDCAFDGMVDCFEDAALHVDDKWEYAIQKSDDVRKGFAKLIDDKPENIVLGANTHDLLIRFISALDFTKRKKIITTDSEFHTVRRQLDRLGEILFEIVKLPAEPIDNLSERIINEIDDNTLCVIASKVFFNNGLIFKNIGLIEPICLKHGAYLIVDTYHTLNAVPFSIKAEGLTNSIIIGGGYKYCQLGEGNCFMRVTENNDFRPLITGWFSEFTAIADKKKPGEVNYGTNHWKFAGSTYDPVSHYRASAVFKFFEDQNLTPELLRKISRHQIDLIASEFDSYNFNPEIIKRRNDLPLSDFGGFISFISPVSGKLSMELKNQNIFTDYRGDYLRMGTAPYMNDAQIIIAIKKLNHIIGML